MNKKILHNHIEDFMNEIIDKSVTIKNEIWWTNNLTSKEKIALDDVDYIGRIASNYLLKNQGGN